MAGQRDRTLRFLAQAAGCPVRHRHARLRLRILTTPAMRHPIVSVGRRCGRGRRADELAHLGSGPARLAALDGEVAGDGMAG